MCDECERFKAILMRLQAYDKRSVTTIHKLLFPCLDIE
jgi:hypothetical protein